MLVDPITASVARHLFALFVVAEGRLLNGAGPPRVAPISRR